MNTKIKYTLECIRHNRRIVEDNLLAIRENAAFFRKPALRPGILNWLDYYANRRRYMRRSVREFWEMRRKLLIYRSIETDLEKGDVASAIKALGIFCPKRESKARFIYRLIQNSPTLENILTAPDILRENMLRLRDDLLRLQRETA